MPREDGRVSDRIPLWFLLCMINVICICECIEQFFFLMQHHFWDHVHPNFISSIVQCMQIIILDSQNNVLLSCSVNDEIFKIFAISHQGILCRVFSSPTICRHGYWQIEMLPQVMWLTLTFFWDMLLPSNSKLTHIFQEIYSWNLHSTFDSFSAGCCE